MESWKLVWLTVAPKLPTRGLERLLQALAGDDPRLIQGGTTSPLPMLCVQDWPCEGACLIGYPFAFEDGDGDKLSGEDHPTSLPVSKRTVGEVEEQFARVCYEADQELGEPAAIRYLLNWYDETPRADMIRALTPCVAAELERRKAVSL